MSQQQFVNLIFKNGQVTQIAVEDAKLFIAHMANGLSKATTTAPYYVHDADRIYLICATDLAFVALAKPRS